MDVNDETGERGDLLFHFAIACDCVLLFVVLFHADSRAAGDVLLFILFRIFAVRELNSLSKFR